MQGQAFLVTFAAIGKSDWHRAAMERDGGKREAPFSRPFDQALGERRSGTRLLQSTTLTLALSRAAGEGTNLCVYDVRNRALCSRQTIVNIRIDNIQRRCKAQNIVVARCQKNDAIAMARLHEIACAVVEFFD